jgi:hypothetical protein
VRVPPGKIWEHLIHATTWPDWYSNASDVTVHEFEPTARIGWYGAATELQHPS